MLENIDICLSSLSLEGAIAEGNGHFSHLATDELDCEEISVAHDFQLSLDVISYADKRRCNEHI